jgi:hypothetical protein
MVGPAADLSTALGREDQACCCRGINFGVTFIQTRAYFFFELMVEERKPMVFNPHNAQQTLSFNADKIRYGIRPTNCPGPKNFTETKLYPTPPPACYSAVLTYNGRRT